ncbi:MAG TPA: tRNA pseudouridine(38-40) synthase TruA [Candidatus Accumulibacter phosphatis]|nr:MAG: tRNA pseudouridine synthase A [Candidatus Accumulibacter sp. SK-11]HAY26253.1 tRNA pseudouridine(38-40) synthase TruA [Accumulibacter sp.]HRL78311.1 tRNA pseudouridine(38-40) synthase TruA [Candidatus Accumulibacter phosphatis]HCN67305.1 tRNA pseudouridine(38-40) synthase TruA [Accumulibacter sp.]HCV13702.1 tRNA pseudouridine(38-40) synthase TruA [Accumulibacter sp.]
MRIALAVEYEGSGFRGWQQQPGGGTVQDVLQEALQQFAQVPLHVVCAGRTDTGVHALGQVVHFDTTVDRSLYSWVRGTNTFLPAAVAVRWAQRVPAAFHARSSASSRHYRYLLLNRMHRPGTWHGRVGWYHHPLDLQRMREAAALLLGEQDFSAFRAAECQAVSPVKIMQRADIRRDGDLVVLDFVATAFLHHMVRNLVGSLVAVGQGKRQPQWIGELLASRDRRLAAPTFPAAGLYLVAVNYPSIWGLPAGDESDFIPPIPAGDPATTGATP